MKQINNWLFAPENQSNEILDEVYVGFDFDKIDEDIFSSSRTSKNSIGAINDLSAAERFVIDKKIYGPEWFSTTKEVAKSTILTASEANGQLVQRITEAKNGDIIELNESLYTIPETLLIDKKITIRSKDSNSKSQLVFAGKKGTPAFEMYPGGTLRLENLKIKSKNHQLAFAPLIGNMASAYNLFVENCTIEDFACVLKAYKASFADSIHFTNSSIQNCENGFLLASEIKGDYNAEILSFDNCIFKNVQKNVIHFYRGGYDESTIGGCLSVTESSFIACGAKEESGILIKNRGIINVDIQANSFENNPVKYVAILWGEKNNHHSNNTLNNSGQIIIEEQQKQEILY